MAHWQRTRDCSPGHAGKEGPQLARTGASQGFPRAAAPVGVVSPARKLRGESAKTRGGVSAHGSSLGGAIGRFVEEMI